MTELKCKIKFLISIALVISLTGCSIVEEKEYQREYNKVSFYKDLSNSKLLILDTDENFSGNIELYGNDYLCNIYGGSDDLAFPILVVRGEDFNNKEASNWRTTPEFINKYLKDNADENGEINLINLYDDLDLGFEVSSSRYPHLTSVYGEVRSSKDKETGELKIREHYGFDMVYSGVETYVNVAVDDGIVVETNDNYNPIGGRIVVIENIEGERFRYLHMVSPLLVKEGAKVVKGQPLGFTGSVGRSTARHLHFEYYDKAGVLSNGLVRLGINIPKEEYKMYSNLSNTSEPKVREIQSMIKESSLGFSTKVKMNKIKISGFYERLNKAYMDEKEKLKLDYTLKIIE